MKILDKAQDHVIDSQYLTVRVDYEFALEKLIPLMDRLKIQRKVQETKFYKRLKQDIVSGCILPSLTIAFSDIDLKKMIEEKNIEEIESEELIGKYIDKAFVLDGIQRLNTLKSIGKTQLDLHTPLYVNIIFSDSMNKLLYRMIVLNNGQKPMSPRHQIEILMENIIQDYIDPLTKYGIVATEKEENKQKNIIKKSSLIKGYLAFVTKSTNIDNQKIIESKLDEIITGQIIDSKISEYQYEFSSVMEFIIKTVNEEGKWSNTIFLEWIRNENNLIGFCAGIGKNPSLLYEIDYNELDNMIKLCDEAYSAFNPSKVKISQLKRTITEWMIENYESVNQGDFDLGDIISEISILY